MTSGAVDGTSPRQWALASVEVVLTWSVGRRVHTDQNLFIVTPTLQRSPEKAGIVAYGVPPAGTGCLIR